MSFDIVPYVAGHLKPPPQPIRPLEMIRQFTPNWFAATMGTGVLALVLPQLPGLGPSLRPIAETLWWFDVGLFVLFSGVYGARWALFGHEAKRIFGHSVVSMFIGTIPMGLATILNGALAFALPRFGQGAVEVVTTLWWLDVAMSVACGVGIPYLMFTRQEHRIDDITAVWLLPVVAAEVAAVTGGLLAPYLLGAASRFLVLITCYVLWAYSVPVAFGILSLLILRMALHKLPPASAAASSWLALGPIGTGALGMMVLGADAPSIFNGQGLPVLGTIAQAVGVLAGILLWGFGLWWLCLAVLVTICYFRAHVPFNISWWGYTFPLGVYTLATLRLGVTLDFGWLSSIGYALAVALALMWVIVTFRTLDGGWKGYLFVSPCIANVD